MPTLALFLLSLLALPDQAHGESLCTTELPAESLDESHYRCLRETYSKPPEHWPAPHVDEDVAWQELSAMPDRAPSPADNPFSEAKAELGETLFFDPKLSRSGQIACASCHEPDFSFSDARRVSFGHDRKAGTRNSPSLVSSGLIEPLFWDGRAKTLEDQALFPIVDPVEMAFSVEELVARLNQDKQYPDLFKQAFGQTPIDAQQIAQALATYQRTLTRLARATRFENFMRGRHDRLRDEELHGLHLFRTQARCINCHFGAALSDGKFHNAGMTYYGRKYEDLGRYALTGKAEDVGRFRTPSLRLVSRTGPWIHNGLFSNLQGVLNFYNVGMPRPTRKPEQKDDPLFPETDARFKPLNLSADQMRALRAFLDTL